MIPGLSGVNTAQLLHHLGQAALLAGAEHPGAPLLHLGGAVGGGEGDGGAGEHGDVVLVVPHAVDLFGVHAQVLHQVVHHAPLVAPLPGELQQHQVGEDHLVVLAPPLQHVPLGPAEDLVVLLEDHLAPGQGHVRDGGLPAGEAGPPQVVPGDGVGLVGVHPVVVVGLEADVRDVPGHLLDVLPHPAGEEGLVHHLPGAEVVEGGAVGQDYRRVDGHAGGMGGEVGLGPAGGHGEGAAVSGEVGQGLLVFPGNGHILAIEGVVKVADKEHAVKLTQKVSPQFFGRRMSSARKYLRRGL